jgi:hypothetical protein
LGCIYNQNLIPGKSKQDLICEHMQSSIGSQHYKNKNGSKIKTNKNVISIIMITTTIIQKKKTYVEVTLQIEDISDTNTTMTHAYTDIHVYVWFHF